MNFPIFASFLVLSALIFYENKKTSHHDEKLKKSYWDRENEANSVRKQPLDDLQYIHVELSDLPIHTATDDIVVSDIIKDISRLSEENIVNFTGYTNTDLKLRYGVANLPYLQKCDMNYTSLACHLNEWCHRLYELGYEDDALKIAEYAIDIQSDATSTYYLAADIYIKRGEREKINSLIDKANLLNYAFKNTLINKLKEKLKLSY